MTPLVRTLALKFCLGFIRSRAAPDLGLAGARRFLFMKGRAGERWSSADRAFELPGAGNSTRLKRTACSPLVRTLALEFCIGFIRSRAARDVGLA